MKKNGLSENTPMLTTKLIKNSEDISYSYCIDIQIDVVLNWELNWEYILYSKGLFWTVYHQFTINNIKVNKAYLIQLFSQSFYLYIQDRKLQFHDF